MTAEWMPENPCDGCSHKNCVRDADRCERLYIYRGKVIIEKAILEYLIAHPDKYEWTEEDKEDCIKIRTLKSMLSQLEAK